MDNTLTPVSNVPQRLDQHPAAVYVASLGAGSRRTMHAALNKLAQIIGAPDALAVNWAALRFQHTAAIRAQLAGEYQAATANKMLAALRGTLRAARDLGQMDAGEYNRAVSFKILHGETLPRGRALSRGEIAALLQACAQDDTPAGARDGAILALLRAGGLRRAELCALDLADYDAGSLDVRGKGNKMRAVPLATGANDALADWLELRGAATGPLFCPIGKDGTLVTGQRLTPQAIYNALAKRAQQAGVKNLSPHDFRRTFVSDLLDAGADIVTVQKLAGHANVTTTARYDRRGEQAKRKAVDLLHVPYTKRRA